MERTRRPLNRQTLTALSFAAGHINVSAADKIPSETLFAAIKGEPIDQKFDYHRWMFFDETDTATIADLVLGGEITFAELAATADRLLPESHDTRIWLDERRNT